MKSTTQPFIEPVAITKRDRKRLAIHLTGWNHLNELFMVAQPDLTTLKKLLVLEMEDQKRPVILSKLVGRIMTCERKALLNRIQSCLKNPLKAE